MHNKIKIHNNFTTLLKLNIKKKMLMNFCMNQFELDVVEELEL